MIKRDRIGQTDQVNSMKEVINNSTRTIDHSYHTLDIILIDKYILLTRSIVIIHINFDLEPKF